jgi:ABC-type amino acid transport substrate-binding protein
MRLSQWQKAAPMAALLLNTTAVYAEQAKADVSNRIKTSETIVLGYRADALPFSYRNTQGQATGYAVEFCKAAVKVIENRLGIKRLNIVWKEVNNTNRFSEIEKGNVDLECSDTTNTIERHKLVDFGPTYFVGNTAIGVNNNSPIRTFNQLQGQTIAVARNTTFVETLKQFRVTTGISFKESLEPSYQASSSSNYFGSVDPV